MESPTHSHGTIFRLGRISITSFSVLDKEFSSDRKSTRLNSSHSQISYAVFCLKTNIRAPVGDADPQPRRLPPGAGAVDGVGLRDHRLRRGAGPSPVPAEAEAIRAARCRRTAPV